MYVIACIVYIMYVCVVDYFNSRLFYCFIFVDTYAGMYMHMYIFWCNYLFPYYLSPVKTTTQTRPAKIIKYRSYNKNVHTLFIFNMPLNNGINILASAPTHLRIHTNTQTHACMYKLTTLLC